MKLAGMAAVVMAGALAAAEVRQPVMLGGKPFPAVKRYVPPVPAPQRTIAIKQGDDLQKALCALQPGERLQVARGAYRVAIAIDGDCRNGTPEQPIQVVFERGANTGAIAVRRSHWHIAGSAASIAVERATHVSIDAARGTVHIGRGARNVTLSNAVIAGTVAGVEIVDGAEDVVLTNNRLHHNDGSIRIRDAKNVQLTGNTLHHDRAASIRVEKASGLRIVNNTFRNSSRAIEIESATGVVIRSNQLTDHELAISLGRVGDGVHAANDVALDHNHLESKLANATGIAIEAGTGIRVANNVLDGYGDAILLLGRRPSLASVTVANNLVLDVTRTAFAIRDRDAAALFDFNVFSPRSVTVEVDVEKAATPLATFLERGSMPNSSIARVLIMDRDLARLGGIETVDRGTAVTGLAFDGKAPDLGVAER